MEALSLLLVQAVVPGADPVVRVGTNTPPQFGMPEILTSQIFEDFLQGLPEVSTVPGRTEAETPAHATEIRQVDDEPTPDALIALLSSSTVVAPYRHASKAEPAGGRQAEAPIAQPLIEMRPSVPATPGADVFTPDVLEQSVASVPAPRDLVQSIGAQPLDPTVTTPELRVTTPTPAISAPAPAAAAMLDTTAPWVEAFAARLVASARDAPEQPIALKLSPAHLGDVEIRIEGQGPDTQRVQIVTATPAAEALFNEHRRELSDEARRHGTLFANVDVTSGQSGGRERSSGHNRPSSPLPEPADVAAHRPGAGIRQPSVRDRTDRYA